MLEDELKKLLNETNDGVEPEHMDRLIRIARRMGIDVDQYEYYFERWGISTLLFTELYRKCVQSAGTR